MKNEYLENLEKIEFVVTNACTGKCKHCSEGEHCVSGEFINAEIASQAVEKTASLYRIKTVMAFGGEPLLYPETVFEIMKSALKMGVPKRQIITNGYFSKNTQDIRSIAKKLAECGVNEMLLSVDAFHQETIPLDVVKIFASAVKENDIPLKLQPAWLRHPFDDNPYNRKTREILDSFADMELYENEGNIIFPEGNAKKYLSEYFTGEIPENPYVDNPKDVRCLSFSADGSVLCSNVYEKDILDILKEYKPQ